MLWGEWRKVNAGGGLGYLRLQFARPSATAIFIVKLARTSTGLESQRLNDALTHVCYVPRRGRFPDLD